MYITVKNIRQCISLSDLHNRSRLSLGFTCSCFSLQVLVAFGANHERIRQRFVQFIFRVIYTVQEDRDSLLGRMILLAPSAVGGDFAVVGESWNHNGRNQTLTLCILPYGGFICVSCGYAASSALHLHCHRFPFIVLRSSSKT